jgi:hypothetical protein
MAGEDLVKDIDEDVHLETLDGTSPDIENRAAKERAFLRRIDKRMMPLMMLLCTSNSGPRQARLTSHRHPQLSRPK